MKVIYVDDDLDLLEVFKENMEFFNIKIDTFISPLEILEQHEKIQPDILITDFRMAKMTGVELARKLPPNLPKVLLTADFEVETDGLFLKIFNKPLNYEEMSIFLEDFRKAKEAGHTK
jgi:FixJ family two-component response regulator